MGTVATASITDIAETQHGAFAVRQAAESGVSARWLENMARRGQISRAAPGVYVVSGSAPTWKRSLSVGLLALGDESWVSHEAAAALHRLDRALDDPVEFTVLRAARGRRLPFVVHSTNTLPLIDRVTVGGFRCTSATRTAIDLARARIPRLRLEASIDSAVRLGLSAPSAIAGRLAELRGRGRWGAPLIDRLLADSGGHSMLERRFLELVRNAGLPRPRTQVIHRLDGKTVARVDFLFEAHSVVVETSGKLGHSAPSERAKDAQRRNELQDLGRKVYEYTWEDVTARPDYVVRTLIARLNPQSQHSPRE